MLQTVSRLLPDLQSEILRHFLSHHSGDDIRRATRRIRDNQVDRAVWILLRKRRRCGHQKRYRGKEQAEKTAHDVLPNCGRLLSAGLKRCGYKPILDAISTLAPGRPSNLKTFSRDEAKPGGCGVRVSS